MVVNGQFLGQLNDQFPMAAVVVNCPPFRGALTACHPHQGIHHPRKRLMPTVMNKPRPTSTRATPAITVPVRRWHGLDDPPRQCSRTFAYVRSNRYTFSAVTKRRQVFVHY
jgi:hypothetical protein